MMKICDRTCNYAHYFLGGLMYCQVCEGLIIEPGYITDCMKYWNKTSKEIMEYFDRLNEKIAKEEMKFLSTFTGVGGFELGIQKAMPDAECVARRMGTALLHQNES